MTEGSDSAPRPGRSAPFDQDALDEDAPDLDTGDDLDEPDFEGFLAATRTEGGTAPSAAGALSALAAAVADADREAAGEGTAVEVRPAAVAVMATFGGPSLERSLGALCAQDCPGLTVLALDGSASGPAGGSGSGSAGRSGAGGTLSARIAAVAPRALVRRVDVPEGGAPLSYAALANDTIETVQGATFLVFCADGVVLDRDAVRVLVDEAVTSNAGIAAPKLVADGERDVLVDVGWLVDRYGEAWSIAEPGEHDQEQHDAVRDVFWVSSRAMLVRCDLFAALGGFDEACGPAAARDLAWRARLAGARVIVVPEACGVVVADSGAGRGDEATTPDDARALTRGRIRAVGKSMSSWSLVWTLPLAYVLVLVESLVGLVVGRGAQSAALIGGALDAVGDTPELLRERKVVQAARVVPDSDLRPYMVRGSARIRRLFTRRLRFDERLAGMSLRTRALFAEGRPRWRRREGLLFALLVIVSLLATRGFVSGSTPAFGELMSWPHASTLFHDFAAGHRSVFFGADVSPPPLFAACGALVALFLGHADLARTALVTLAIPLGILGVYAMLRRTSARAWPALAGAAAYAANPVSRNAIANGELGVIALFVLAPLLWLVVAGRPPDADGAVTAARTREQRIGHVLRLALLSALVIAWWPPAVLLPLLFAGATLAAGGMTALDRRIDIVVDAAWATVLALVLLLPWSLAYFSGDGARVGFQARPTVTLHQLVAVNAGANGAGVLGFGLFLAAVLPLLIATGDRLRRAVAAWLLVVVALVVPLVAQHVGTRAALPETDGLLVIAALGLAVAIGLGVAAFLAELRTFIFGARQLVAVGCLVMIVVPIFGWFGDVADGRVRAPHAQWNDELSWMPNEAAHDGDFRVLWIGPSQTLPGASVHADGIDFSVTDSGVGDLRLALPPTGEPTRLAGESISLATAARTERLGRLLAPLAVRYVAVVDRAAPDAPAHAVDQRVVRGLDDQLDLELYDTAPGLLLYRNGAWAPREAVVPRGVAVPTGAAASRDPIASALGTDLTTAQRLRTPTGAGTLLLSDHAKAEATLNGTRLQETEAFGWAHAWVLPASGTVKIGPPGPWWAGALLTFAIVLWFAVVVFALRPGGLAALGSARVRVRARAAPPPDGTEAGEA